MYSSEKVAVWEVPAEPFIMDLYPLFERFEEVADLRRARGKRYPLPVLLSIAVLAKLAGQQHPQAMAEWAQLRARELARLFGLWRQTMPVLRTWERVFSQGLDVDQLDRMVCDYMRESFYTCPAPDKLCVALDGKTLRGTIWAGNPQGVHLLALYFPRDGIVLAQMEIASKANEITAAPHLLRQINLQGLVITGDAMFAQRTLSLQIVAAGGDYLWGVKGNQPALREDIATLLDPAEIATQTRQSAGDFRTAHSETRGHGRLEKRTLTASSLLQRYSDFPHLAQVFKIETQVTTLSTQKVTLYVRYGVTSLSAQRASADDLLALVREHWGIESGLHYRRDVTLGEDRIHARIGHAAHVHAILNNALVALLHERSSGNMARGIRKTTYVVTRLLSVCSLP